VVFRKCLVKMVKNGVASETERASQDAKAAHDWFQVQGDVCLRLSVISLSDQSICCVLTFLLLLLLPLSICWLHVRDMLQTRYYYTPVYLCVLDTSFIGQQLPCNIHQQTPGKLQTRVILLRDCEHDFLLFQLHLCAFLDSYRRLVRARR
jgi:hypothetical protein